MSEETVGNNWLAEMEDQHTDESAKSEVTRKETLRNGRYRMTIAKVKPEILEGEKCPTPGRKVLRLQAKAQVPAKDSEGNEIVKSHMLFFDVSPEPYKSVVDSEGTRLKVPKGHELYTPASKHDLVYKGWAELETLIGGPKGKPTIGEVVNGLENLEFSAYVSESFIDPAGNFQSYKKEEERAAYIEEGWDSKNFVMQIRK